VAIWYVLRVRANRERAVARALLASGITPFIPTCRVESLWSDRRKVLEQPIFPGYVFAFCESGDTIHILQTGGVIGLLPNNLKPEAIPDAEVDALRLITGSGAKLERCEWIVGEMVEVQTGAMAGLKGPVLRTRGKTRVVVRVEILHRAVSAEVDAADLKPCSPSDQG
jgi:transcriptional antiterminator NusG